MQVSELLPKLKANNRTYYNLAESQKNDFRKLYRYLHKHKNKSVSKIVETLFPTYMKNTDCDYLVKYYAMKFVSTNIIN